MKTIHHIQRGFSLVSAIFLLVVIAALGAFAVTLSTTQHQSAALDVTGARAYHAARAGIEWGVFQVLRNTGAAFVSNCRAGASSQVVPLAANTLSGFTVNVGCTSTSHSEGGRTVGGGNPVRVYTITATATQGTPATPDYVERQISVTLSD